MNLTNIDLNLFLVLHTVLQERSATRAAKRLHITQSAVSNSLSRLRSALNDPLVIRSNAGMIATPRAKELAPLIEVAIKQLQAVLDRNQPEDPAQSTRQFTLACADNQQVRDVPKVALAMAKHMPLARLRVVGPDFLFAHDGLARGIVDAFTGPRFKETGLYSAELYSETAVALVRRDHPYVRKRLTREQFNSLSHVDTLFNLGEAGVGHRLAEKFFRKSGLKRRVSVSVPSFATAAMVAAHTDHIACLPRRVAEELSLYLPLRTFELPARGLNICLYLMWHARTHNDATAAYFRKLVISTLKNNN